MSEKQQRTYPMTEQALEDLRAELEHKLEVERPALAARLKAAIEMGDLTENAEYISAKEDQAFLEGRIQQLQQMIRWAVIIDQSDGSGTIRLGSRVTVVEVGASDPETFMIVGVVEANPLEGKISDESPLGSALVGCSVGDVVRVDTPGGQRSFEVTDIA
jgi:transcription elongation factor GreA